MLDTVTIKFLNDYYKDSDDTILNKYEKFVYGDYLKCNEDIPKKLMADIKETFTYRLLLD